MKSIDQRTGRGTLVARALTSTQEVPGSILEPGSCVKLQSFNIHVDLSKHPVSEAKVVGLLYVNFEHWRSRVRFLIE